MQTCPECGNHDMAVRILDGSTVHECGLCGARFGDRRAVAGLAAEDEAHALGIDAEIWPLAKILRQLPGLDVGRADGGSQERATLPSVELLVTGPNALQQIENLAKALRLASGSLRCRWVIEAYYEHALAFAVAVRSGGPPAMLRDARIDVDILARQLQRDMHLSWWRHAKSDLTG